MKRNRLIPIILLFAILLSSTVYADDVSLDSSPVDAIKIFTEEEIAAALAEIKRIEEAEAPAKQEYVFLQSSLIMNPEIASTYAGAYFDEDKNLVILSTVLDSETITFYRNATRNSNISVCQAKYTLDELKEEMYAYHDNILQLAAYPSGSKERNAAENITLLAVDVVNNCIVVQLKDISDTKQMQFKELISDDSIDVVFEIGGTLEKNAGVYPGQGIYWSHGGVQINGSVGYPVEKVSNGGDTMVGFTSAGHVFYHNTSNSSYQAPTGTPVYSNNTTILDPHDIIGMLREIHLENNGNTDIAFIERYSTTAISHDVVGTNVTLSTTPLTNDLPRNSSVILCGIFTFNRSASVLYSDAIQYDIDGDWLAESLQDVLVCFFTTGYPYPGDSGGVVYTSNQIVGSLIGQHSAIESQFYVAKVGNALDALDSQIYVR